MDNVETEDEEGRVISRGGLNWLQDLCDERLNLANAIIPTGADKSFHNATDTISLALEEADTLKIAGYFTPLGTSLLDGNEWAPGVKLVRTFSIGPHTDRLNHQRHLLVMVAGWGTLYHTVSERLVELELRAGEGLIIDNTRMHCFLGGVSRTDKEAVQSDFLIIPLVNSKGLAQVLKEWPSATVTDKYFRYDVFPEGTINENEDVYFEIRDCLRENGWIMDDPCIEHDCISGYIRELTDKDLL